MKGIFMIISKDRVLDENQILHNHTINGFYVAQDPILEKYHDRWDMCERIFNNYSDATLLQHFRGDPKKTGYKLEYFYKDYYINIDIHLMLLPKSFDKFLDRHSSEFRSNLNSDSDYRTGNIDINSPENLQYVVRKKMYFKDRTRMMIDDPMCSDYIFPEYEYFLGMFDDFKPVLEHYERMTNPNQETQKEMTLISYEVPFATDEDILIQKSFSSNTWGLEHSDELIGALHLGESHQELQVKNIQTAEWEFIPPLSTHDHTLWLWGEYASKFNTNYEPTMHRMVSDDISTNRKRYSIIFNLGLK